MSTLMLVGVKVSPDGRVAIAQPVLGINCQPVNFEYIRFN
jgi:hypothetical protein